MPNVCQSDLNYVEQGKGRFDVALLATVAKDYKKASAQDRGKVERAMRLYARTGHISNPQHYKEAGKLSERERRRWKSRCLRI